MSMMVAVKPEPIEPTDTTEPLGAEAQEVGPAINEEEAKVMPSVSIIKLSGYVPNQPIPPNDSLDENLMASFVLHPIMFWTFMDMYNSWQAEAREDPVRREAIWNRGFEHQVDINPAFAHRFVGPQALCPASVLVAGVVRCFAMAGLQHQQHSLPSIVGLIGARPEIDANTKMMGLVASQDLPKGFVFGPLGGYYLPSDIAAHQIEAAPMNPEMKCTPERWKFECARYLFETQMSIPDPQDKSQKMLAGFSTWGMGYGGQGMLMNDAVSNPVTWIKKAASVIKDRAGDLATPEGAASVQQQTDSFKTYYEPGNNVEVVGMDVRGMPIPFLVLSQDVAAGTPLYRAYGLEWWKRHMELRKSAAEAEEEAEETQGPEAVAALAAESGLEPLSVLGAKGVSSAFVPPEQQGAVVPFVDLTPPQEPAPPSQTDAAAAGESKSDVSRNGTVYMFDCMNDPCWRDVHRTWYSENARCWEQAQQQALR